MLRAGRVQGSEVERKYAVSDRFKSEIRNRKSTIDRIPYKQKCLVILISIVLFVSVMTDQSLGASIQVGNRKQLFIDDWVVAEKVNVERRLGTVTKANNGKPIFTDGFFYGTVLYDDGKFKLWFRKFDSVGYGYAESHDGFHFEKKADVTGIPFASDKNLAVEIDPHESDPAHRYKGGFDAVSMATGIAYSADGIQWNTFNNGEPVTYRAADCYNHILWDPLANVYRLFTRTDYGPLEGVGGGPLEGTVSDNFQVRGARGMTNPDIRKDPTAWKLVRHWHFGREGAKEYLRRQIYAMTVWIYEGIYFALMSVYEHPGDVREGLETDFINRHDRDITNFYIGTSRDCDSWDLSWVYAEEPIIPRGPNGSFDKDGVSPSSTVVTHDDRHWLYYSGNNERHGTAELEPPVWFKSKSVIGLATLRLDGFIGLHADATGGTVTTKPFLLEGDHLQVNIDGSTGSFSIEVLDEDGRPVPGFDESSAQVYQNVDNIRLEPQWKGSNNLASLKGEIIHLKFKLNDATLYAFQIGE